MMSYHPGTGELFVKLKVLPNYFDLIGTANGMVVMQHSLRYLFRVHHHHYHYYYYLLW